MTPLDLLVDGFNRIPRIIERALHGLDRDRLAAAPWPHSNSLAWLAWHTARGQDSWVADLEGRDDAWTSEGWFEAFALPLDPIEIGFAMADDKARLVVATGELLGQYLNAVTAHTIGYLTGMALTDLDEIVDAERTVPVTRGIQLLSILDDNLQHAGQAAYVRGVLDRGGSTVVS